MLDGQETRGNTTTRDMVSRRKIGRKFAQPGNDQTRFIEPQAQLFRYHVRGDNFNMHNGMRIKEFEFRETLFLSRSFVWVDNRMDFPTGFSGATFRIF